MDLYRNTPYRTPSPPPSKKRLSIFKRLFQDHRLVTALGAFVIVLIFGFLRWIGLIFIAHTDPTAPIRIGERWVMAPLAGIVVLMAIGMVIVGGYWLLELAKFIGLTITKHVFKNDET